MSAKDRIDLSVENRAILKKWIALVQANPNGDTEEPDDMRVFDQDLQANVNINAIMAATAYNIGGVGRSFAEFGELLQKVLDGRIHVVNIEYGWDRSPGANGWRLAADKYVREVECKG